MSIEDKLLYLNETKRQLREAINAVFGAGLNETTPFGEYANVEGLWNPRLLFLSGEQGAWYDPSDLSTLFQDAEGTIPVAASGDPVGLMLDKSGNGNHATQEVSAARPVYLTDGELHWLQFDGVADNISTQSGVDMTHTNSQCIFAGLTKEGADGTFRAFLSTAENVNNTRGILVSAPSSDTSANYRVRVNAGSGAENIDDGQGLFSGVTTNIVTNIHVPGDLGTILRVDRAEIAVSSTSNNDGNFETRRFFIGSRLGSSNFFRGRVYGLVITDSYKGQASVTAVEQYLARKTGVTL